MNIYIRNLADFKFSDQIQQSPISQKIQLEFIHQFYQKSHFVFFCKTTKIHVERCSIQRYLIYLPTEGLNESDSEIFGVQIQNKELKGPRYPSQLDRSQIQPEQNQERLSLTELRHHAQQPVLQTYHSNENDQQLRQGDSLENILPQPFNGQILGQRLSLTIQSLRLNDFQQKRTQKNQQSFSLNEPFQQQMEQQKFQSGLNSSQSGSDKGQLDYDRSE